MIAQFSSRLLAVVALLAVHAQSVAEDNGTKVYQSGMKSAVKVIVPVSPTRAMMGSGSVVNLQQGYILTNWHVVRNEKGAVLVQFPIWEKNRPVLEKDRYEKLEPLVGSVYASDEKCDLAIIKLAKPGRIPRGTTSIRLPADSPLQGETIHSIGNPGASDALWVYTPGKVRSVYKKTWVSGGPGGKLVGEHAAKIIEATSPTSPGDSGGPCFNDKCELVGVTQGGLNSAVASGYSFFIDSSDVKVFLKKNKIAFNVVNDTPPETSESPSVTMNDPTPKKDPSPKNDPTPKIDSKPEVDPALAKQEKEAASRLNLIRSLAKDPSKKAFAVEQLQKIVKMYPKTAAAKEAQTLLKEIP